MHYVWDGFQWNIIPFKLLFATDFVVSIVLSINFLHRTGKTRKWLELFTMLLQSDSNVLVCIVRRSNNEGRRESPGDGRQIMRFFRQYVLDLNSIVLIKV